jgi:DNA gyrase/topoisomerase IV subunit B
MKHCPQCEFTFDDQEQDCDFDGTKLRPVPELLPSFKKVSFAPASTWSSIRHHITSSAGQATLALAGLLLSALLAGYYDSVNQSNVNKSTSQAQDDRATMVPSTQVDTVAQAKVQAERPRIISTQRKIGADELPSSLVKRLLEGTRAQSAKSRRNPSDTKLVVTKRGPSNSRLVATRRKPRNATRQSQATNPARPGSRDRGRQQHSIASVTYHQPGRSANESAHHRKDSKVVAILKKTGSILKKPFDLIVDR